MSPRVWCWRLSLTNENTLPFFSCFVIICEGRDDAKHVHGEHIGLRGLTWQRGASYRVARCGQVQRGSGGGYVVPDCPSVLFGTAPPPPHSLLLYSAQYATQHPFTGLLLYPLALTT